MSHTTYTHTRQRMSSVLTQKHPGLQPPAPAPARTRIPHSRLPNFTLPFLNLPGSRIRKASPTVSLTHASVNVNAAAASYISIDIITIDSTRAQLHHDHHEHYIPSINLSGGDHVQFPSQTQTINIIPFPSSAPAPCPASPGGPDWVSPKHGLKTPTHFDDSTPSKVDPQSLHYHRRTPLKAILPNSIPQPVEKTARSRTSKAKRVRAFVGSSSLHPSPSPSSSRKSHKRLVADIQFLETIHRSIASHRMERRADGNVEKADEANTVMDVQECRFVQRLSDVMIELGHRVPPSLSCKLSSPFPSPPGPQEDAKVEAASPVDLPRALPIPASRPRSLVLPVFPPHPPGLFTPTTFPLLATPPPLCSPPLPPLSLSPPVLSMPQLVAALMMRRRERGGADGARRREGWCVRKSRLVVETRME